MPDPSRTELWKQAVQAQLHRAATEVEEHVSQRWSRLMQRLGLRQPRTILAYHGWANGTSAWCGGRVLANKPAGGPKEDDDWWDNLLNTYRRWQSNEVPGVTLEAELAGVRQRVTSDEEGYFEVTFELPRPLSRWFWHEANVHVVAAPGYDPQDDPPVQADCGIMRPPEEAQFGVISDVDDTVIHSDITNLLAAARLTFLSNARSRKPLEGVAELYRALQTQSDDPDSPEGAKPINPFWYISSSAWNLYDLLSDFMDLNDIPLGPLMLRDLGIDENKLISSGHGHKQDKARRVMDSYPDLPFVLFGDSGQHDARLYAELAAERPEQIKAIFIRDISPGRVTKRDQRVREQAQATRDRGVAMHLVEDSVQAARHAIDLGLLPAAALPQIEHGGAADRRRPQ
jgi:phosphatidate phosphatase APP1